MNSRNELRTAQVVVSAVDAGRIRVDWSIRRGGSTLPRPPVICGARHPFGRKLGPLHQDVVRVALAVHSADRLLQRSTTWRHHARGWSRHMVLQIPVFDAPVWNSLDDRLIRLLSWMTGDTWEITFVQIPWAGAPDQVRFPLRFDGVALFSGGLDSLAGYVAARKKGLDPIPFGVSTHRRTTILQQKVMAAACQALGVPLRPVVRIPLRVPYNAHRLGIHFEASQRTRGFLYLSLAAVIADVLDTSQIWVYENGVGAINLPLVSTQLGPMSSRSVHPRTVVMVQQLLSRVLNKKMRIELPYVFSTKGQLVEPLISDGLSRLAHQTMSCDNVPRQEKPCGTCTSCLLSRMALGESDDPGRYEAGTWTDPSLAQFVMRSHASQLEHVLRSPDPWESLTQEFPELWVAVDGAMQLTGLQEKDVRKRLLEMYKRSVREWQSFAALSGAARK